MIVRGDCLCNCKTFSLLSVPRVKANKFCYRTLQHIIRLTHNNIDQWKATNKEKQFCP